MTVRKVILPFTLREWAIDGELNERLHKDACEAARESGRKMARRHEEAILKQIGKVKP
jgi:hypothetical protein